MVGRDYSPGRLDSAGFDYAYVDSERFHFHAQGIAEGFNGVLGNVIPGPEGYRRLSGYGRSVDYASAPALPHSGKHQACQGGEAEYVHFQLPARFFHGNVLHGSEKAVAGVVDEHVDTSFGIQDEFDTFGHGGLVGHVHLHGNHSELAEGFKFVDSSRGSVNLVPLKGQHTRGIESDSAARAGYQNNFRCHILEIVQAKDVVALRVQAVAYGEAEGDDEHAGDVHFLGIVGIAASRRR